MEELKLTRKSLLERFFRFPLHFAITPLGRYSISLAQILFWILIVIFALVYVGFTQGRFLKITGQMLTLLGISGATALVSKATARMRFCEIPLKYMKGIKKDRLPHFRDLFSIGDTPNIFKFQIFAFTLVTGIYVVRELLYTGNFPVIDGNLLTLMGISGSTYFGNELVVGNVWKKLDSLTKRREKAAEEEKKDIEEQIRNLLKEIYTEPDHSTDCF